MGGGGGSRGTPTPPHWELGGVCQWGPPNSDPSRCGAPPLAPQNTPPKGRTHSVYPPHPTHPLPSKHSRKTHPGQDPPPPKDPPNLGVPNSSSHLSPRGGLGRRLLEQVGDDVVGHVEELLVDLLVLPAVIVAGGGQGGLGGHTGLGGLPTKEEGDPKNLTLGGEHRPPTATGGIWTPRKMGLVTPQNPEHPPAAPQEGGSSPQGEEWDRTGPPNPPPEPPTHSWMTVAVSAQASRASLTFLLRQWKPARYR